MPLRGALQARVMVRYAASFRKLHFNVLIFLTVEGSQVADHVRLTTLPLQCAAYWVALKRKKEKNRTTKILQQSRGAPVEDTQKCRVRSEVSGGR